MNPVFTEQELEANNADIYVERAVHGSVFHMSYEHTHTYCEIFYLRRGSCTYTVEKAQYHLEAGDLFIVAAGAPHSTRYEGNQTCERIIVFCKPDRLPAGFLAKHPEVSAALSRSAKVILNRGLRADTEKLLLAMIEENDIPSKYSAEFLLLHTLSLLLSLLQDGIFSYERMSPKDGYSADIEQALKYIALNYMLPLTLEGVAQQCNLSPTYFSRKFKIITGRTFKEHLNYIRLRQATQMLRTTDDTITKIAAECGFSGSNYFKDLFRKTTGLSPRAYRKQVSPHGYAYRRNKGEEKAPVRKGP